MKNIVVLDDYNEIDLKPSGLLHKYIELTEKDVHEFLIEGVDLEDRRCPGCLEKEIASSFAKFGLRYVECANCGTLYISPSPSDRLVQRYFVDSGAREFWHNELRKSTNRKRQEKIIKPRIEWLIESTEEHFSGSKSIADINTSSIGFMEELMATDAFSRKAFINPLISGDEVNGLWNGDIVNTPWWDVSFREDFHVVSAFEVVNRVADVELFFSMLHKILKKEGLCFITAILISGFDLQILWDKAISLFPPDRHNVFSLEGLLSVSKRHNFECVEFSTPGILDVEIVKNAIKEDPEIKVPKFIKYLLESRSRDILSSFQEFLQAGLLSSYCRMLLMKK